jgi:hypothetical protein
VRFIRLEEQGALDVVVSAGKRQNRQAVNSSGRNDMCTDGSAVITLEMEQNCDVPRYHPPHEFQRASPNHRHILFRRVTCFGNSDDILLCQPDRPVPRQLTISLPSMELQYETKIMDRYI